jgi:hypothetical protein
MDAQQRQIDENFDYFERNLSRFLQSHAGEYVLLRDREEVGFFDAAVDALREGKRRFPDGIFSIQEVTDQPLDLGFLTLV